MAWFAVFAMGLVLGLIGGGGGILTVPILVGLFGVPPVQATGKSLLVVGLAALLGASQGIWKKETENQAAVILAIPSSLGAFAARAWLVPALPERIGPWARDQFLLGLFALLMLVVATRMLMPAPEEKEAGKRSLIWVAPVGLAIGLVSGLLGAGGGFLILPALTLILGIPLKRAIPTSLLVIAIQSLIGFSGELGKPIDFSLLGPVVGLALAGLQLGLFFRDRAPKRALQIGFAVLVYAVAIWMISKIV